MLKRKCGKQSSNPKRVKPSPHKQITLTQSFLYHPPQTQHTENPQKQIELFPHASIQIRAFLRTYLSSLKTGIKWGGKRVLLVKGPMGWGKTYLVRKVVNQLNLNLLQIGISSQKNRNRNSLWKVLGEATQALSVKVNNLQGKVIFIDDVDVVLDPDWGFDKTVFQVVQTTKAPIILTATETPALFKDLKCIRYIYLKNIEYKLSSLVRYNETEQKQCGYNLHKLLIPGQFQSCQQEQERLDEPQIDIFYECLDLLSVLDHQQLFNTSEIQFQHKMPEKDSFYRKIDFKQVDSLVRVDYDKIVKENLLHFSQPTDHIWFLSQLNRNQTNIVMPSYIVRHHGESMNQLSFFLSKNPNKFT